MSKHIPDWAIDMYLQRKAIPYLFDVIHWEADMRNQLIDSMTSQLVAEYMIRRKLI